MKRYLAAIAIFFCLILCLSACGGGGGSATTGKEDERGTGGSYVTSPQTPSESKKEESGEKASETESVGEFWSKKLSEVVPGQFAWRKDKSGDDYDLSKFDQSAVGNISFLKGEEVESNIFERDIYTDYSKYRVTFSVPKTIIPDEDLGEYSIRRIIGSSYNADFDLDYYFYTLEDDSRGFFIEHEEGTTFLIYGKFSNLIIPLALDDDLMMVEIWCEKEKVEFFSGIKVLGIEMLINFMSEDGFTDVLPFPHYMNPEKYVEVSFTPSELTGICTHIMDTSGNFTSNTFFLENCTIDLLTPEKPGYPTKLYGQVGDYYVYVKDYGNADQSYYIFTKESFDEMEGLVLNEEYPNLMFEIKLKNGLTLEDGVKIIDQFTLKYVSEPNN